LKLIIVESPNKIKKIKSFLDSSWDVSASVGHICDLPDDEMGIDIDSGTFEQKYSVYPDKKQVVSRLKDLVSRSNEVYLASDPDREGEAISWHLCRLLKLPVGSAKRIEFHSITKEAVQKAIKAPRRLDLNLVEAYKARRAVDRIFGYQLSPELQKFRIPSAGRCQTPCLFIVVQREREIANFKPKTYYTIKALYRDGYTGEYAEKDKNDKFAVHKPDSKEALAAICSRLNMAGEEHSIVSVEAVKNDIRPPAPFITSSVLMAASSKLHFEPKQTTNLLQALFQGGYITYIRTDSVETSPEGIELARKVIQTSFPDLLPEKPNTFKVGGGAQGAHECIRPTHEDDSGELSGDELKLYSLIRNRFLASQCKPAQVENVAALLKNDSYVHFLVKGQKVLFPGWKIIYEEPESDKDDEEEGSAPLPALKQGDKSLAESYKTEEKQTKPPSRFRLATLTKEIERLGIGRPSTFSTIVQTPLDRQYYEKNPKQFLVPTQLGNKCIEFLEGTMSEVLKAGYTADMESGLDKISDNQIDYKSYIHAWYSDWSMKMKAFRDSLPELLQNQPELAKPVPNETESKEKCPDCGEALFERKGPYGKYLHCKKCVKNISPKQMKSVIQTAKAVKKGAEIPACPLCKTPMVIRSTKDKATKKLRQFWGCPTFPKCQGLVNI
jgi:DNA topoisomerase-1